MGGGLVAKQVEVLEEELNLKIEALEKKMNSKLKGLRTDKDECFNSFQQQFAALELMLNKLG